MAGPAWPSPLTPGGVSVLVATIVSFGVSVFSVSLRLTSRKLGGVPVGADDISISIALVFKTGLDICGILLIYGGIGQHVTDLNPNQVTFYLMVLYCGSFLYPLTMTFVRLSALALYRRIFNNTTLERAIMAVAVLVIVWCFAACVTGIVICIPVEAFWRPTIPGAHCLDLSRFYYGLQIPNIVIDLIILALPLRRLWLLAVPLRRKLFICGIFCLGLLATVCCCVRLYILLKLARSNADFTYNQAEASVWTTFEPAIAIITVCLPTLKPLMGREFRQRKSSHTSGELPLRLDNETIQVTNSMTILSKVDSMVESSPPNLGDDMLRFSSS